MLQPRRTRRENRASAAAQAIACRPHAARDAVDLIEVDIAPLPAISDPEAALAADAPRLHGEHPNVCLDWRFGDHDAAERAFARAAHVVRLRLVSNRVVVAAMEPRAAVADYHAASGRFTSTGTGVVTFLMG
jgi:aerobic carbon-monoxide dehydrogenase large subunit